MTSTEVAEKLIDDIINKSKATPEEIKSLLRTKTGRMFFITVFETGHTQGSYDTLGLPRHQIMEQKVLGALKDD